MLPYLQEDELRAVPAHQEHEEDARTEATEAPDHFPAAPVLDDAAAFRPGTGGDLTQSVDGMAVLDLDQLYHSAASTTRSANSEAEKRATVALHDQSKGNSDSPVVAISFDEAFSFGGEVLSGELGAFSEGFSTRLDPAPQLNWAGMRPYELKKHCRARGLAEEGSKATLVARLEGREQPEHSPPVGGVAIVAASDPVAEAKAVELKEAAKSGSVDVIQALLADDGVDVDVVDGQGYTPLYCATMYEQEDAVAVLLAAGAEVDKENNNGVSPLMAAARDGYTAILTRLLSAGADFLQVDECPVVLYKIDR